MGVAAHSSFTARGIAERQAAKAVDPELIERRREYEERTRREADERQRRADAEEIARLREANRILMEREAKRVAEAQAANAMLEREGLTVRSPRMKPIAERICKATGVSMEEVRSARRSERLVMTRWAIAYWTTRQTGHSLPAIGRFLGGKDHTSILHAVRRYPQKRAAMGRHLRPLDTGKRGN